MNLYRVTLESASRIMSVCVIAIGYDEAASTAICSAMLTESCEWCVVSVTKRFVSSSIDEATMAYARCAMWSSSDDDGEPLDARYSLEDISPALWASMRADCADFLSACSVDLMEADNISGYSPAEAGYDFWLTRNGHGVGFWDRGLGAVGDRLTEAAHVYSPVDLYVGDDGLIYS